jgi:hypothetical protein
MPGQKPHGRHIVFPAMPALVTGSGGLTVPRNRKRITLLAVGTLRNGARAKPRSAAQEHQHSGGQ